jgi:hypothetical protein
MKIAIYFLVAVAIASAYWIGKQHADTSSVRPSATEIFNLRSACAKLAENIEIANRPSLVVTYKLLSHYEPRVNRCFAELSSEYATRLYDGQTSELLVEAWNGTQFSFIKGGPEQPSRDAALAVITRTMADDWKP